LYNTPKPGATATQFSATYIKDLFHQYPNGTNHAVSAPNALWAFFKNNELVSSVREESPAAARVMLAPNPAREYVRVSGAEGRVIIRSMIGESVFNGSIDRSGFIALPQLARGAYFVSVSNAVPALLMIE
ncbi:MAG: T9SS type A sorting domain-containing protein, partial [bacterium]|nr:T9SS type A sorting domain-containing protein [Candidatus Kapabacteria bacterium]